MPVTSSSGQWVLCARCGEFVEQSAGPEAQQRYHGAPCWEPAPAASAEHQETEPAAAGAQKPRARGKHTMTASPLARVAHSLHRAAGRGHGRSRHAKAGLGLVLAIAVAVAAGVLVGARPAAGALPQAAGPATSARPVAHPPAGAADPGASASGAGAPGAGAPGASAPGIRARGTAPGAGPVSGAAGPRQPAWRASGSVPAQPRTAPSASSPPGSVPAPAVAPPALVQASFSGGTDGWEPLWGRVRAMPAWHPAYNGTAALLVTPASGGSAAVGTSADVAQLTPGDTVTYHLWVRGGSGHVQPLVLDARSGAVLAGPAATAVQPGRSWITLTWTVPATSSVTGIGLQISSSSYREPLTVALGGLSWPAR